MKPLAKIIVRETAGIRRFLYPLEARFYVGAPSKSFPEPHIEPPPPGQLWAVADSSGMLVPSYARYSGAGAHMRGVGGIEVRETPYHGVGFAISLAPYEERELVLVETDESPSVPDALRLSFDEADGLLSQQERVTFHLGSKTGLDSVVYDGLEHLAGPLSILVNSGSALKPTSVSGSSISNNGLTAGMNMDFGSGKVRYSLTACKSWVTLLYIDETALAGKTVQFSLPLSALDETPTCDFGVGNGVYEKIAGDAVVWTTEFGENPYARWRVSTVNAGVERIDYQGEYLSKEEFAGRAWFHWIEKTKALAVAIPGIYHGCDRMTITLAKNGTIDIAFAISPSAPYGASFRVCYHFLNDIPAIAAATNPASILLPPKVEIQPLS